MTPADMIAAALRRERERAGLSLSALAEQAGIAKSTLSQLEAGKGNPSMETLWALATALGVPFSFLFEVSMPGVSLIRADEGITISSDQSPDKAVLLSASSPIARRDIYRMSLIPGTARQSKPHPAGTIEHVIVCSGKARVGPLDRLADIGPGDYYTFPGDVAHSYEATEPGTVLTLIMEARG